MRLSEDGEEKDCRRISIPVYLTYHLHWQSNAYDEQWEVHTTWGERWSSFKYLQRPSQVWGGLSWKKKIWTTSSGGRVQLHTKCISSVKIVIITWINSAKRLIFSSFPLFHREDSTSEGLTEKLQCKTAHSCQPFQSAFQSKASSNWFGWNPGGMIYWNQSKH